MPDIRDMELLAALARQRHFARAAEECGISQPAFSTRIRNLELELGVPVVQRGNRFQGFTEEGEIVLKWARRILLDTDGLKQELALAKDALSGVLSIGVVPTALAYAARIPAILRETHPGLTLRIYSLTTDQIHEGLESYALDAGLSYLNVAMPKTLAPPRPLYEESYVLVAPPDLAPRKTGTVSWAEAARLPLCLATRDLRNRRFLDEIFERYVGAAPQPVLETNSMAVMLTQVQRGAGATIAPSMLAESFNLTPDIVRMPLTEPEVTTPIGLLLTDRDPVPPAVQALSSALKKVL